MTTTTRYKLRTFILAAFREGFKAEEIAFIVFKMIEDIQVASDVAKETMSAKRNSPARRGK